MIRTHFIRLDERAVLFRNEMPVRALAPGKYRLWGNARIERFNTDMIIFKAAREVRAVLPNDWFAETRIGQSERGLVYKDDVPVAFLRPGVHRYWTVDPSVTLRLLSIEDGLPELSDELLAIIPRAEFVLATVNQYERGLLYVQGKFERMLSPGRYGFWTYPEAHVVVQTMDMRLQQLAITGQELMTRDKVTLRMTLTVEYAPADPPEVMHSVADVSDALYLHAQLAAREYVAGVTLDELLEGRDAMQTFMSASVVPKATAFGVDVRSVGLKDIVLPGEMKLLLNRVIEAEKAAAANVIMRREEAAATRVMANAAKVMADNPVLLKLKQMDALKEMAQSVSELRLVVGAGDLKKVLGGNLLDTNADKTNQDAGETN